MLCVNKWIALNVVRPPPHYRRQLWFENKPQMSTKFQRKNCFSGMLKNWLKITSHTIPKIEIWKPYNFLSSMIVQNYELLSFRVLYNSHIFLIFTKFSHFYNIKISTCMTFNFTWKRNDFDASSDDLTSLALFWEKISMKNHCVS